MRVFLNAVGCLGIWFAIPEFAISLEHKHYVAGGICLIIGLVSVVVYGRTAKE